MNQRAISAQSSVVIAHHHHWASGLLSAVLTHRPQEHPRESTVATASDHKQVGVLRGFDQHGSGRSLNCGRGN